MYRPKWFETDRSILEIALETHMMTTGASDYDQEQMESNMHHLSWVLNNWKPSTLFPDFDNAVKEVIRVAYLDSILKGEREFYQECMTLQKMYENDQLDLDILNNPEEVAKTIEKPLRNND